MFLSWQEKEYRREDDANLGAVAGGYASDIILALEKALDVGLLKTQDIAKSRIHGR